jgi:hypothetical protein
MIPVELPGDRGFVNLTPTEFDEYYIAEQERRAMALESQPVDMPSTTYGTFVEGPASSSNMSGTRSGLPRFTGPVFRKRG